MPIPMGRSGNMDGEGRTENGGLRGRPMARTGGTCDIRFDPVLRIGMEPPRIQPGWSLRWTWPARTLLLAGTSFGIQPPALAPESSLAELPNDADSDGTDGS